MAQIYQALVLFLIHSFISNLNFVTVTISVNVKIYIYPREVKWVVWNDKDYKSEYFFGNISSWTLSFNIDAKMFCLSKPFVIITYNNSVQKSIKLQCTVYDITNRYCSGNTWLNCVCTKNKYSEVMTDHGQAEEKEEQR